MMKNKISTLLSLICGMGAWAMSACSYIEEDERLVYVEPAEAKRVVLVEDFTGQKCVNCPNATNVLNEVVEVYGEENVIPVAIHCGPFGLTNAKGLVTEAGKTYWNAFFDDTQGQPVAKINRGKANDDYINWSQSIATELAKPTDVTLSLQADYNPETREVALQASALGKAGEQQKLQLWLLEDSIVAIQSMPTGPANKEYVHNHVLRDAINGVWGEEITFGEEAVCVTHTYRLDEKFNAANCSVVAFCYDDKNGVSQAAKVRLGGKK